MRAVAFSVSQMNLEFFSSEYCIGLGEEVTGEEAVFCWGFTSIELIGCRVPQRASHKVVGCWYTVDSGCLQLLGLWFPQVGLWVAGVSPE